MGTQLKVIQSVTSKGKSSSKLHQAADKLDYLITFNWSITQAMAHTMQDLFDGVFIKVAILTLARRDSYLEHLKAGIKQDTPHLLGLLYSLTTLFQRQGYFSPSHRKPQRFHPYSQSSRQQQDSDRKSGPPAWKQIRRHKGLTGARPPFTLTEWQSPRSSINDNYCVSCVAGNLVNAHVTGIWTCSVNYVTGNRIWVCVTGKKDSLVTELTGKKDCFVTGNKKTEFNRKFLSCCRSCSFCKRVSTKERCKSQLLSSVSRNKACE